MAEGDELQRLVDVEAIQQLRARYARAIDTKDWALFADSLAEDARLSTDRGVDEGRDHIVAVISRALADATTVHHLHQPEIEITGPDAATGIWAMNDLVDFKSFSLRGYGHYNEEYVRTESRWKIKSSTLTRIRVDTEGEVPGR
jgi:uncharacterized protein (TIGR02246 family)